MLSDSGYDSPGENFKVKSDAGSDEGAPLDLKIEDEEGYRHLSNGLVVDGVSRGPVTSKTRLAALYDYDDDRVDNNLVRSLANTVGVSVSCQLETSDGKVFPPSAEVAQQRYYMRMTFRNLYLAPAVRLECRFIQPWSQHSAYLTLATEFHFNDYTDGEDNMISAYSHRNATIQFAAGRATCSGFNLIEKCDSFFGEEEREVIEVMRSFTQAKTRHQIMLHLKGHSLSPEAEDHLHKIRARLPGGGGKLLPSIGAKEYTPFDGKGQLVKCYDGSMLTPAKLLSTEVPFPMVPLECRTTFSSVREAAVQLAYSATVSDEEAREALRLWAAVPHDAELYLHLNFPILALYFRPFDRLGGRRADGDLQFRLPHDMNCGFVMADPVNKEIPIKIEGFMLGTNPGIVHQDGRSPSAVFRITSRTKAQLEDTFVYEVSRSFRTKCDPHYSSFTYNSQLEAVRMLQATRNKKWWPLLLNQKHDELPSQDPTEGVPPHRKERAEVWLRGWKNWNPEQLAIIDGITATKGGMTLIMGPAATGKTLLQRGIAIYFYSLGYHVAALAPANDNANKLAKDLLEIKAELAELDWIDLDFLRLFPGSRDVPVDEMTEQQAGFRKEGHRGGDVLPFREMLNKLEEDPQTAGPHRTYGVVESIIRHAEEKTLKLFKATRDGDGQISDRVDTWETLRELIAAWKANELDMKESKRMELFRVAYLACKGQVVGLNRFIITTTGNVRSREMRDYWFSQQSDYGVPRKGVVVLVDEAAKDLEVNVWSGIVSERWSEYVKGVFLFGDDKQLLPTNTSAKGRTQYNYFSDRLDIPLPNRLEQEGFPCFRLLEQRRMHEAISAFPNAIVYNGKLRNGPGMDVSLETHMPGLRQTLLDILAGAEGAASPLQLRDNDLRRHYFEVYGKRVEYEKSIAVHEHIDVFMKDIFPKLFEFFRESGRSMKEDVMIICAYNYARSEYDRRIKEFLRHHHPGHTTNNIPRIMSVDGSQGDEAFMVFFDASAQQGHRVGFMQSENRFNVAITRAKGVMWMIGGSMRCRDREPNLITRYKRELDIMGQVSHFRSSERYM
ncbi:uncharacterized protein LTR77_007900 [Saxophila tyrrhenica]|uniref:DNA2/NAM7 helicase-like C-terminal domain-containing protein n=1 Tax=Saxophila tyrrhenica TaxID=1690608 RepID=A0AAV9P696_9PEZI|nr:hypothetical protein LTR77_007900 [Saxophila tyrrhenica]